MNEPITLPDDALRDHINDLVMQVLAREKLKRMAFDGEQPTLRDQLAMAALTGICAHQDMTPTESKELAECAYDHADAMLEVRKLKAVAA